MQQGQHSSPTGLEVEPAHSEDVDVVTANLPLVRRIAHQMRGSVPRTVDFEDVVSWGVIGLIEAAERFDGTRGDSFAAFVAPRIRGSILDNLRALDPLARQTRRHVRIIDTAESALALRLDRAPTAREVKEEAGLTDEQYERATLAVSRLPISLDAARSLSPEEGEVTLAESVEDPRAVDFTEAIEHEELLEELARAITQLPEREQLVIGLRYNDGLKLKEIAAVMQVSETRVCQLSARAVERLRRFLSVDLAA